MFMLSYGNFFEKNAINALMVVRIIVGLLMIYHGKEVFDNKLLSEYSLWDQFKGFSNPKLVVTIGKGVELVCGILLTIGFYTRIGALLLILSMLYITFFIGKGSFWYGDQHPFLFVLLGVIYLFFGGGNFSIDNFLNREK
jgi:putative oxidoreductase